MKTAPLTSRYGTPDMLGIADLEIAIDDGTYTVIFDDAKAAIAQVDAAKAKAWKQYLKGGGNPRNSRSFGSQFAAIKKAILKAVEA